MPSRYIIKSLPCRLARIKEVSGNAAAERMLADVLGKADLDLDEYDKAMAAAFDDSYYQVRVALLFSILCCVISVTSVEGSTSQWYQL